MKPPVLALLAFGIALGPGCGSGLLVNLVTDDYTFPSKKIVRGAIAARATGAAVQTIIGSITELVPDLVTTNAEGWACLPLDLLLENGVISFPLALGPLEGHLGARDLEICLDLQAVTIELIPDTDPAQVRLIGDHVEIALSKRAVVSGDASLLGADVSAACLLDNDLVTAGGTPFLADISFDAVATLHVDEYGTFDVGAVSSSFSLWDVGVQVIEDCSLPECMDDNPGGACLECTICDIANFGADLLVFIQDALGQALDPLLTQLLNLVAKPVLDGVLNGRPISIQTELSLGNVLAAITSSARTATPLGVLVRPAPEGIKISGSGESAGLDLHLEGGTTASKVHPCVQPLGVEPDFAPGPYPDFGLTAPGGEHYDLALGVSEAFLNQILWSLRSTGALCLELDAAEVFDLSQGAIAIDASLLDLLVPGLATIAGRDASVRVSVDPVYFADALPIARVSASEADAALGAVAIHLANVGIGIDVFLGGRWVRLASLAVDLSAGLEVAAQADAISLTIGQVVVNSAAVTGGLASSSDLDRIVDLGVDVLLGVLKSAGSFAFRIDLNQLTSLFGDVPFVPRLVHIGPAGAGQDWLAVYVALDPVGPGAPESRAGSIP